jgi:phosphate transport system substrate-binding protein
LEPAGDAIKSATGIDVNVRGINSGKGFAELREGKITASISSSPLKSLLEKAGLADDGTYLEHKIIEDVIVPIVHKSNPVSELTWQQLSDINTGKITNWKDVGGPDRKIVVITSQPTAATRVVFQKKVMKKAPYIKGVREVKSTRQEVNLVAKFKGGIGAVSEAFVAMNPGKVNVVKTDSISRPLSFITKGKPNADVQTVIDYLKTPSAQKLYK